MEIGKLYKSVYDDVVVKCTGNVVDGMFSGIVVSKGRGCNNIGCYYSNFNCDSFEEYTPTQILTNGHTYNIPEGCKATIKDGVITIEDDIKYYKTECGDYISYIRKCSKKYIGVTIYEDGFASINNNDTFAVASTECSEKEFMDAYNKVLKQVQL